ncbi:MAG: lamin tail domain-containing protein, partial [Thermoplasmata archaeon]
FVEVAFPSPGWPSVRVSLALLDPLEALLPLAAWVRGSLPSLVGFAATGVADGARLALSTWLAERLQVRLELAWATDLPSWMGSRAGVTLPDAVGLVLRGEVNMAGLAAIGGATWGRWEGSLEVLLRGVPGALMALVPGMGSPDWDWAEVTLVRARVEEVSAARLVMSQVLYDARGRDSDLEYVEVLNAGNGMLDLHGFRLEDEAGTFRLRGHLPLLPGDRMLVVRNSSAVKDTFGVVADLGRMGLRLANDGDALTLLDPEDRVLDRVAWEGHLEGWVDLEASEGEALVRLEGDHRRCQRAAWTVGVPDPRRSGW